MTPTQLRTRLAAYDGKDTGVLITINMQMQAAPGFQDSLCVLADDPDPQIGAGATWLLKHRLEHGTAFTPQQTARLMEHLPVAPSWAAQLHVCQILRRLIIDYGNRQNVAVWLRPLLDHERPFLRAWSLDALCALADQDDRFTALAARALAAARADHAASVRARARNLERARQD